MATEILTAIHDPIVDRGITAFSAAALTHTSRVLSANLAGELWSDERDRDFVHVLYSTNKGVSWATWASYEAIGGVYMLGFVLEPITVSAIADPSDIQVKLDTSEFFDDTTATLHDIILTCDTTPVPPGYCHGSSFGF